MTGVLFIVSVPNDEHEKQLKSKEKKRKVYIKDDQKTSPQNAYEKINNKRNYNDNLFEDMENSPIKQNYEYVSMLKLVTDILICYNLEQTSRVSSIDNKFNQFVFTVEEGERCEGILEILRDYEVGLKYDSTISISPGIIFYHGNENADEVNVLDNIEKKKDGDTAWSRFVSSVRARLTVAQIVEDLKVQAALTFDFICLLVIAAFLCAIGLAENSNVYLLSSMLISPMMGPVMAATFGSVIRDRMLQKVGVQSEFVGVGVAMLVGFCYGCIICLFTDKYGETDWPTNEMTSRGEIRTLGVGCLIALLSGAAVAVGVLSDNIASLVGVAISTSLMPPAVNAGLLWSLASIYYLKGNETTRYAQLSYTEHYSTDRFIELGSMGAISLCLTFVNIICIYAAAILVFKIKEVAPISSKDHARKQFWKHDIKVTRDYNKTLQRDDAINFQQQFHDELESFKKSYGSLHLSDEHTRFVNSGIAKKSQNTWTANTGVPHKPTIQELQKIYITLMHDKTLPSESPIVSAKRNQIKRLSWLSNKNDSQCSAKLDDSVSDFPEISVDKPSTSNVNTKPKTKSKKFTVTPCDLDRQS